MKKMLSILLAAALLLSLTGCGADTKPADTASDTHIVVDHNGNEVELPYEINRVVGLAAEYAIGRRSRTGTLGSYRAAWATRGEAPDVCHTYGRANCREDEAPTTGKLGILLFIHENPPYINREKKVLTGLWSGL